MYVGVCLAKLGDIKNSRMFFEKALSVEDHYYVRVNFAIMLHENHAKEEARAHLTAAESQIAQIEAGAGAGAGVVTGAGFGAGAGMIKSNTVDPQILKAVTALKLVL
eukprot:JZ550835.1.p2 GENE.JZ550835.1~~JZ550835.1.p2  ORF type:complete len:107 (+),score=16.15 JZ550835.1:103-423(+)